MAHPNPHHAHQQQRQVAKSGERSDDYTFFNLLTGPELFDELEAQLPDHRERLFPPTETLSMFLSQALSTDRSCQNAVDQAAIKRMMGGLPSCSTHTGAYCRARQRLPIEMVRHLACHTGCAVAAHAPHKWHWRGRPVRLVDGTTVRLPDTAANQAVYPQPCNQRPGLGFPLCRLVGVMSLGTGTVLNAAIGRYHGKGANEQALLRSMLDTLEAGDVIVGDAFYPTYFLLCALQDKGVDGVFEQHGSRRRTIDFRRGQRVGHRDHLIRLYKPANKPDWMAISDYEAAPDSLVVRESRTGGKTLVSTFCDATSVSKPALKALYKSRWHVELDLRHIKSTLGMETLSCQSPAMAEKEVWVYLLAYNLIRLMMAQAASLNGITPRQISFKHTVQLFLWWRYSGHSTDGNGIELSALIAQQRAGHRPGRIEPRAVKRRPKPFPLLTQPRSVARDQIRKHGHPRKLK